MGVNTSSEEDAMNCVETEEMDTLNVLVGSMNIDILVPGCCDSDRVGDANTIDAEEEFAITTTLLLLAGCVTVD